MSEFSKVLIGDDRMILCKEEDFSNLNESDRQLLIRTAFPELAKTILLRLFKKIQYIVVIHCYKMISIRFDSKIKELEVGHSWDNCPFVAIFIYKERGDNYCKTTELYIEN